MDTSITRKLKGKTILITGGTGSFGNSVVGRLLKLRPLKIIIFSRDEKKQFDMRNEFDNPKLRFVIGDVRDKETIKKACRGADYIFHAAALKQVPTCEFFPMEAVKTNIIGTHNVLEAAIENKVSRVVVLGTDKAVYPINAIGISKAMMEKVMIAESKSYDGDKEIKTVLCGVRYGNVLYTRGSVIPYFVDLIKKNKRLPVTDFKMTRFLLPLDDAVSLVLYALIKGKAGYIYVKKSPACTLETLAKAICQIFNFEKGFFEVGIRAGEKVHETLVTEEELIRSVEKRGYFEIPPESQGLDYNKYFYRGTRADLHRVKAFTSASTIQLNVKQTVKMLLKLPEIKEELKKLGKKR
ncbi:MAG: UDP-glucose 4-epimerase [Candidatus Levybacteria bacterium RBG_16_35_11]|nr:MAG: UDP-glucose 4-epimerase [Candidatus Levybacteria bacterium RBG_16_35_11]